MPLDISKLTQLKQLALNNDLDLVVSTLESILAETSTNLDALSGEIISGVSIENGSADGSFRVKLTKENESTEISADYVSPSVQRIEVTEMPNDFQAGDILIIPLRFDVSITQEPANWTTAPSTGIISIGVNSNPKPVVIVLGASETTPATPVLMSNETTYKLEGCIGRVYPYTNWNTDSSNLIQFEVSVFNGGANVYQSKEITKTEAISYFDDFIRIRV